MVASFFRNALLLLSLNLLVKGVYLFGVERGVQNTLPEGDYGLYFSLLGFGLLLQLIADAGLQLYNSRTVSGHRQLLAKYFPYFLGLKLVLGAVFFLVLGAGGYLLGYRDGELLLLGLVGVGQFFGSFVLYLRSNLGGLGRYRLDSWFSILDKSLMILIIGSLLVWAPERLTIFLFAGAQVLCWAVTAVALLVALRHDLKLRRPRFHRATFLMLLRGGAPFAIVFFLQTAYTRTDAVMIERLLAGGAEAAGHYAAAYRLLDAMNVVGWLLTGLLLPMYARLHARGEDLTAMLRFSVHLLVGGGIIAGICIAAYATPIVYLLYDFADARTAVILFFLALAFVAQTLNYAYGSLLSAAGLIGRMNYVFAVGIVLNVCGNLWVLPRYGAEGAALVTLVTQGFIGLAQAVLAHRWLRLPAGVVAWARLIALAVVLAIGAALLAEWPGLPWGGGFAFLIALGTATAFGLRLLDGRELVGFLGRGG